MSLQTHVVPNAVITVVVLPNSGHSCVTQCHVNIIMESDIETSTEFDIIDEVNCVDYSRQFYYTSSHVRKLAVRRLAWIPSHRRSW